MKVFINPRLLSLVLLLWSADVSAQVSSTFNTDADGWTATAADAFAYSGTLGNPGGCITADPFVLNLGDGSIAFAYFDAPAKFLGNKGSYFRGTLRFQAYEPSNTGGTTPPLPEIILSNNAGIQLFYYPTPAFQHPTTGTWATFSVRLDASSGFWKTTNTPTGQAATQAILQDVISDIATLQIRGLFRHQNTIVRLDNVTLRPPIIINTQPSSVAVCVGTTATLTTAASNNPNITYQWQVMNALGAWVNVTNGGGFSGATTATLSINTTGNVGAGQYRCVISGLEVEGEITNTATITVNAVPNPPTATGGSRCGAGAVALSASGGVTGQYRWYTAATGGTAIGGQTGPNYSPNVTTTTTYYVAINNGTCESTRRAVTATVNPVPSAPVTTGRARCNAGTVTLTATGGNDGQYRWYTTSTGGTAMSGEVNGTYTTPSLTASATYYVSVNNGTCESPRTAVVASISPAECASNEPPVIDVAPLVTQIEGVITIDLSDLVSDSDNNLDLSTLTITSPPPSGAPATIDDNFNLVINYGGSTFVGRENISLLVCDLLSVCTEEVFEIDVVGEIVVYNAISPNGDRHNPAFIIEHIEKLQDTRQNRVTIFNRWGDVVWEGVNYDNATSVFTGTSKDNGDLPSGVYFYRIEFTSGRKEVTGYLTLKR